jgi:hypothetical protein
MMLGMSLLLVVKFNNVGARLWATTYDHANLYDFPTAIEKASNDNIVVTGASASAPNSWDYATILVNGATGQIDNVQRVNVPEIGLDRALAVTRDPQNNLFITGYNEKVGNKNIQTVKLNSNFGLEWVKTYDSEGLEDIAKSIGCDAFGNVYVAGHSKTVQEGDAFIVLKYDAQGSEVWKKSYKPHEYDGAQAADLKVMPTGDFYLSGTIQKGTNTDFATLKYNKEGQIEWEKRFEGLGTDEVTTIEADNFGNVYVSGISEDANGKKYSTVKYTSFKSDDAIVYRFDGKPSHKANELVVKFAPAHVNHYFVDDGDWFYDKAEIALSDDILTQMENVLPFSLRDNNDVIFSKIFTNFKTTDTISISRLGERVAIPPFWSALSMHFSNTVDIAFVKNQLSSLFPLIEFVEYNYLGEKHSLPNDSLLRTTQHSLILIDTSANKSHINIDSAWTISTGKQYIKTGVYDESIHWRHPDFGGDNGFSNSAIKGGKNYITNMLIQDSWLPLDAHGTAVAGIIGALRNNRIGISGIAGGDIARRDPGTALYSLAIFNNQSYVGSSTAANAICDGASSTGHGLHIQNHSWGVPTESELLRKATRFAFLNQCVLVASRGNNGTDNLSFPACYEDEWVISVGGAGSNGKFKTRHNAILDNKTQFNFGRSVDIIAPSAFDDINTLNAELSNACPVSDLLYRCFNATSAAAAHVTGGVALMLSLHNTRQGYPNNLAPDDVEHLIQKYSKDVIGTGLIDSFAYNPVSRRYELVQGSSRTVTYAPSYDIYNGWGFLDVGAVLRMIDTPRYYILHPQKAPTSRIISTAPIRTVNLLLKDTVNGKIPGTYNSVRVYEVTEKYDTIFPSHIRVIDAWKRLSSTNGYKDTTILFDDPWTKLTYSTNLAGNSVSIEIKSYFYQIGTDWIPFHPSGSSQKFKYSLHLENRNWTPIHETVENMSRFKVFPNPTDNQLVVDYELLFTPTALKIDIFDITGKLVQQNVMPSLKTGVLNLDVQGLVKGTYLVRLSADGEQIYRKIVKL